MKTLGKSLFFCLKYWILMRPVYEDDEEGKEALLSNLPKRDQYQVMVEKVADRASEQAAEFLIECANEVVKHFKQFCNAEIVTSKRKIQEEMYVTLRVWPAGRRRPEHRRWAPAISLENREGKGPVVVPYILVRGGKQSEEKLAGILGNNVSEISESFGWRFEGRLGISEPIRIEEPGEFEIKSEPLIQRTVDAFATITKEDVERMSAI